MRIDYSEPKKSYTSAPVNPVRQRHDSPSTTSVPWLLLSIFLLLSFVTGFGSGWFFSQKAAKRSFQAAMEQKSLENSPYSSMKPGVSPPANVVPVVAPVPPAVASQQSQPSNNSGSTPEAQQFSFYKNLPNGQKSTVIGSGINNKDDGKSKQALQAAIPSNVAPASVPEHLASPANTKTASTSPVTPEKNIQGAGYSVQVASFPLRSEAEQSKNKLFAKGYGAYIVESNLGAKGIWYRVQIGKKMEQGTAKELAAKIGKGTLVIPDHL